MIRKARTFQPGATTLESRLLLSLATARSAEVRASKVATGSIPGRYFAPPDNRAADAPLHVDLTGAGRVRGLGRVTLRGSLDLGGFRVTGSADVSGSLILTNARGSVTLRLTGSGGFAEVPNGRFATTVAGSSGTGAYAQARRSGKVVVQFGANEVRSFAAPSPIGGAMTVKLRLKPAAS